MRKYSVILLVLLGLLVVVAGTLELLREASVLILSFKFFGGLLIIILGLWVVACAIECRSGSYQRT